MVRNSRNYNFISTDKPMLGREDQSRNKETGRWLKRSRFGKPSQVF